MAENVDITYIETLGTRGTGNFEFDYPQGICSIANNFYVCDKQNNRIQLLSSTGQFVLEFGGVILDSPHSVLVENSVVYVSDTNNHRICRFSLSGNFLSEYGTRGDSTTTTEFDYPCGLAIHGDNLYVADRQNDRVMVVDKTSGAFVNYFAGFSLPEAICIVNDDLYVITHENTISQYNVNGDFIRTNNTIIQGVGQSIKNILGVLCIVDRDENTLIFLSTELSTINHFHGFDYPFDVAAVGTTTLFITQPHVVLKYQLKVDLGLEYLNEFNTFNQDLYPTGRAWWKQAGSVFSKVHEALALQESRVQSDIKNLQKDFYADNSSMSDDSVEHWMQVFGLVSNGTKDEKISLIKQAQGYPNGIYARQSQSFIESQLQLAGFNVYVHYDPTYNPNPAIYGLQSYGGSVYGATGDTFTKVANNVIEANDNSFNIANGATNLFYIGGSTFGTSVNIDTTRKNEFRELILRLKPAHSVAILFVNYI